jgi:hypothetical protein
MATDHSRPESAIPSADDVWQTESEDTNDDDMDYEVREPPPDIMFKIGVTTVVKLSAFQTIVRAYRRSRS